MTPDKSKTLKPGTRVSFDGDQADCDTIKANNANYVTVKWNDGHKSFTGNHHMKRVEVVK